jgi:RNA polymerase sigma factor (sigma-70 family)
MFTDTGAKLSFEAVLGKYQNLAYSIANEYRNRGVPMEDLKQESLLGLYKAYERFEPERETKFSTYAVFWIKKQVLEALKQEGGMNAKTEQLCETQAAGLVATQTSTDEAGDFKLPPDMPVLEQNILRLSYAGDLSLKEIAARLNISVEKAKQHKQKALRRLRIMHIHENSMSAKNSE